MEGKWERARGMDWEAEVDAFLLPESGKLMPATRLRQALRAKTVDWILDIDQSKTK